jgi:hypothetical protein
LVKGRDDLVEDGGRPKALIIEDLKAVASGPFLEWLEDRKNRRVIPHRLESCGYEAIHNPDAKSDGMWKIYGKRKVIYVRADLSKLDKLAAARERAEGSAAFRSNMARPGRNWRGSG